MKRIMFIAVLCLSAVLAMAQARRDAYVEVLYFHGKQRCVTCRAIEKYAKEAVNVDMAGLVKKGLVRFREVDISTSEGGRLADRYKVSWSSLYVNKWAGGKEQRHDMTRFGFRNARNHPDVFKSGLKQKINDLLK